MKFNGEGKHVINGKEVKFKWDMLALTELGDLSGLSITGIVGAFQDPSFRFLSDFLYVGARRQNEDVTRDICVEWLGEMGIDTCLAFLTVAFSSPNGEKKKEPQEMGQ